MSPIARHMSARDWAILLVLSVLWGGSFFFIDVAVESVSPFTLVFLRAFVAAYRGEAPLHLDYGAPKAKVGDYMRNESRFRVIERADPARFKKFVQDSEEAARRRYEVYQQLAGIKVAPAEAAAAVTAPVSADGAGDAPAAPKENA